MRALGVEQLGDPAAFLLGLAQPLLQARDVAFERLDRRFGGLRAAQQGRLAALGRAARAPFGEEVGLPRPARRARARCLALLDHALQVKVLRASGRRPAGCRVPGSILADMSVDPDERDWRLTGELERGRRRLPARPASARAPGGARGR